MANGNIPQYISFFKAKADLDLAYARDVKAINRAILETSLGFANGNPAAGLTVDQAIELYEQLHRLALSYEFERQLLNGDIAQANIPLLRGLR